MIRPVLEKNGVETCAMEGSWGAEEGGQLRRLDWVVGGHGCGLQVGGWLVAHLLYTL